MAITKQPAKPTTPEAFIKSAPDAAPRRVRKGHKVQITLTITEPLLDRVDEPGGQAGPEPGGAHQSGDLSIPGNRLTH